MQNKLMACIGLFGLLMGACMVPAAAGQSVGFAIDAPIELHETLSSAQAAVKHVESESVDGVIDIGPSVVGAMAMATAFDARSLRSGTDLANKNQSRRCFTCPEVGWRA